MFTATLNNEVVATDIAYAPLEAMYADSMAIITNTDTGVSWPADPELFDSILQQGTANPFA